MHGDGFIRQEGDRWRAYVRVQGRRRSKSFPTEEKAKQWIKARQKDRAKLSLGLPIDPLPVRGITVEKMAKELSAHWDAGVERVYTDSTLASHRHALKAVVAHWGPRPLDTIKRADISAWVAEMRKADLSTSTIRARLDRLAQLFALAEEREQMTTAPPKVKRPKLVQRAEPEAVPEAEYERLIAAARASKDPRRAAVVLLAGDAGLRREEIVRLQWEDLTLPKDGKGTILVNVRDEHDRTKSGKARTVPILTQRLRDALDTLSWPGRRGSVIAGITSVKGLAWMAESVWRDMETARRKELAEAGAPVPDGDVPRGSHLHGLRHRFGTWLADSGASVKLIRDLMGHSTVLTTERYLRRRGATLDEQLVGRLAASAGESNSKRKRIRQRNSA